MKYICELNNSQFKKYNILAIKKSKGLITEKEFKKCLNENDGSIDCFNNEIIQHIEANFKYPKQAVEDNIEGNIIAEFIINEKGKITNIQLTAPENAKILERAAERLIEKLPQFTPATKSNKKVKVKYTIPIEFKLS